MASAQQFSLKAVISATDRVSPTLQKIDKKIASVGRAFHKFGESATGLASKLALPLTALGGFSSFSLKGAVDKFMELGDSIDKASKRAGVATGALQQLRYAAKLGGMSADQMDQALAKLTQNLQLASAGKNKELAAMFKHLGISLKDSSGNARDAASVMRNLAEAVKNNQDPMARSQILTTAFGKDLGKYLIPVLEGGAKGLDDMAEEAKRLGIVMDKDSIAKAAELSDTFGKFKDVCESVCTAIGATLTPVLKDVIARVQDWLIKNKDLIALRLEEIFKKIADAISKVDFESVVNGITKFIDKCIAFADEIGGVETIVKGFGLLLAGALVGQFASVAVALKGLGTAFTTAFGPWGVIIAGVVAAAIMIYKNWDKIVSWFKTNMPGLTSVMETVGGGISKAWDTAVGKVTALWDKLKSGYEGLKSFFGGAWDKVKGVFGYGDKPEGQKPLSAVAPSPGVAAMSGTVPQVAQGKLDGEVVIKVQAADGTRASVEDLQADGGTITAETTSEYTWEDK